MPPPPRTDYDGHASYDIEEIVEEEEWSEEEVSSSESESSSSGSSSRHNNDKQINYNQNQNSTNIGQINNGSSTEIKNADSFFRRLSKTPGPTLPTVTNEPALRERHSTSSSSSRVSSSGSHSSSSSSRDPDDDRGSSLGENDDQIGTKKGDRGDDTNIKRRSSWLPALFGRFRSSSNVNNTVDGSCNKVDDQDYDRRAAVTPNGQSSSSEETARNDFSKDSSKARNPSRDYNTTSIQNGYDYYNNSDNSSTDIEVVSHDGSYLSNAIQIPSLSRTRQNNRMTSAVGSTLPPLLETDSEHRGKYSPKPRKRRTVGAQRGSSSRSHRSDRSNTGTSTSTSSDDDTSSSSHKKELNGYNSFMYDGECDDYSDEEGDGGSSPSSTLALRRRVAQLTATTKVLLQRLEFYERQKIHTAVSEEVQSLKSISSQFHTLLNKQRQAATSSSSSTHSKQQQLDLVREEKELTERYLKQLQKDRMHYARRLAETNHEIQLLKKSTEVLNDEMGELRQKLNTEKSKKKNRSKGHRSGGEKESDGKHLKRSMKEKKKKQKKSHKKSKKKRESKNDGVAKSMTTNPPSTGLVNEMISTWQAE